MNFRTEKINGMEFVKSTNGDYLPLHATTQSLQVAREMNNRKGSLMGGTWRLKKWENEVFTFMVNNTSAVYRKNGDIYELVFNMSMHKPVRNGL